MEAAEAEVDGGATQWSAVKIKRCRYLAESGCAAMCANLCKYPTQVSAPRMHGAVAPCGRAPGGRGHVPTCEGAVAARGACRRVNTMCPPPAGPPPPPALSPPPCPPSTGVLHRATGHAAHHDP